MLRLVARRVAVTVLLSGLVLSACSSDKGEAAAPGEVNRNETLPVELAVTISGDVNMQFEQTLNSHFILNRTKGADEQERARQVLGVQPVEPVKVKGVAVLPGFGILPFEGDRSYTIPIGSPLDIAQQGPKAVVTSSVKVDYWSSGDATSEPFSFMRRLQPCTVVVESEGTKGTVTCPEVVTEAGDKRISFSMRWSAPNAANRGANP